ncbi:MAG TPA: Mur ligase family protein, partial [Chitinophagaceae bacterium]|nr:Mur ligase family protein [Chitinophagaceae bacterium]
VTDAPLIVAEGDEYPASTIEKRPKFHFLYPHIAILTGIAWDHINVFPTFDFYLEQFSIFIQKIEPGGCLIYNATDNELEKLVHTGRRADIEYIPYGLPVFEIANGKTMVVIEGRHTELKVFGNHNLLNMQAAWHACRKAGLTAAEFARGISSFTGASKRLELLAQSENTAVYRDFAHAPSKVKATMEAVKQQYPGRRLVALLELHTYSSLNEEFMSQYRGAMDQADAAAVFYSKHALELKRMPPLSAEKVKEGFGRQDIAILNDKEQLMDWLRLQSYKNANLLLMSSGNYDGADILTFAQQIAL